LIFQNPTLEHRLSNIRCSFYTYFFLYAISDEFHQSFVPGRNMAVLDICFDSSGVLFGYLIQLRNKCRKTYKNL